MFDLDGRVGIWKFQRQPSAKVTPLFEPLAGNPEVPDSDARNRMISETAAYRRSLSAPSPVVTKAAPDMPVVNGFVMPPGYQYEPTHGKVIQGKAIVRGAGENYYIRDASKPHGYNYLNGSGWSNTPSTFSDAVGAATFAKQYDPDLRKAVPVAAKPESKRVFEFRVGDNWMEYPIQPNDPQDIQQKGEWAEKFPLTYRWRHEEPATVDLPAGWKLERACDHTIYDCKVVFEKCRENQPTKWRLQYHRDNPRPRQVYYLTYDGWNCDLPPVEFDSLEEAVNCARKYDRHLPWDLSGFAVIDGIEIPKGWRYESLHQSGVKGKAFVQTRHCGYVLRYSGDSIALAVYLSSGGWSRDFGGAQFDCLADAVAFVKQHDCEIPIAHA